MSPKEIIIRLRNPDCDCCPLYENCYSDPTETTCLLFYEAANCIENLMKGNENNENAS